MCHSRAKNSKMNRLHERCLMINYNNKISTLKQILERSCPQNLYRLIPFKRTEKSWFKTKNPFFKIPRNKTERNGFEFLI